MLKYRSFIQNSLKCVCLPRRAQSSALRTPYFLLLLIATLLVICAVPLPAANAKNVTIGWDANSEPDLEGYVVYRNTDSPGPPYDSADTLPEDNLANPLRPKATLTGLEEGKEYYVALTAYNTEGDESNFSNDVCVEVVNGVVELCSQSAAPVASSGSSSRGGGGGGHGACFITTAGTEASMFSQWVAQPVIRSQVLAMLFLLVVLIVAVKLGFAKQNQKKKALTAKF